MDSGLVGRWLMTSILLVTVACCYSASAQDAGLEALSQVPADVSLLTCSARMKEQYDVLVNSKAFGRVAAHPLVQMGWNTGLQQWYSDDPEITQLREQFELPENQELMQVLTDAMSHESFVYFDANTARSIQRLSELYWEAAAIQGAALKAEAGVTEDSDNVTDAVLEQLLTAVADKIEKIPTPGLVMGFKVSDVAAVNKQLERIPELIRQLPESDAQQAARFLKVTQSDDGILLTVEFQKEMVPWDEIRESMQEESEAAKEKFESILVNLQQRTFTVTVGMRGPFLVITAGPDASLRDLPAKDQSLVDSPVLSALKPHADKPIVNLNYCSHDMATAINSTSKQIIMFGNVARDSMVQRMLELGLPKELIDRSSDDLSDVFQAVSEFAPIPGQTLTLTWLSSVGYEGYVYDSSKYLWLPAPAPLSILKHSGGDSLFVLAGRHNCTPESFHAVREWVADLTWYLEFAKENAPSPKARSDSEFLLKSIVPLVSQLGDAIENQILPGLADGQMMLVIGQDNLDPSVLPEQAQPRENESLKVPTGAIALGVSDREKLGLGLQNFSKTIMALLDAWRAYDPSFDQSVSLNDLPAATFSSSEEFDRYFWTITQEEGLQKLATPSLTISNDVAVLTMSPDASSALLTTTEPGLFGPAADTDRPLLGVVCFQSEKVITMLQPWLEHGLRTFENIAPDSKPTTALVRSVAVPLLEVMKCFRGYSAVTWQEGDSTVTHFEFQFHDLR